MSKPPWKRKYKIDLIIDTVEQTAKIPDYAFIYKTLNSAVSKPNLTWSIRSIGGFGREFEENRFVFKIRNKDTGEIWFARNKKLLNEDEIDAVLLEMV